MSKPIIVENVSKQYYRELGVPNWTLQEKLINSFRRSNKKEAFWALKDVSFSVEAGKMLGVIGHNGAGKSTLFRLVGGLGRADKGNIQIKGKIGALLSLGAGFHSELTGRENIFINGVISGLRRHEIRRKFDSIVNFAEIEPFIDSPLHTYSDGMRARLGFAVATHIDPEILLIDEVLAVGDIAFQKKCLDRIAQFKQEGCTTLIVSHQTAFIENNCDSVLWLDHGEIRELGEAGTVVKNYKENMLGQ